MESVGDDGVQRAQRLAALTQNWVVGRAAGEDDVPVLSSPMHRAVRGTAAKPRSSAEEAAVPDRVTPPCSADSHAIHGDELTAGRQAGGRERPLAGVLSRSVQLVTSIAQHMRSLRSRRVAQDSSCSRGGSRRSAALPSELRQLGAREACKQAITLSALHQSIVGAGLHAAARQDAVEQLVKAGVISGCALAEGALPAVRAATLHAAEASPVIVQPKPVLPSRADRSATVGYTRIAVIQGRAFLHRTSAN
jgi:hypothetical protein